MTGRILIAGAGPTGLGAAWRLEELGCHDWTLVEAEAFAGGLAASFTDERGFTWDMGGHVVFSHYPYFDAALDTLLAPEEWAIHQRQAWIWMRNRFLPYPFQHNLWRLPEAECAACLEGLRQARPGAAGGSFREWAVAQFGSGIADSFLLPYNWKVWARGAEELSAAWVAERVATIDLARVEENTRLRRDDPGWGPNQTFRYPLRGGNGEIWSRCAARLPAERIQLGTRIASIDAHRRVARTTNGEEHAYDALISTLPLPRLLELCGMSAEASAARGSLPSTSTHAVGIGISGNPPAGWAGRNWIYFPEENCPFYRATVFSGYSPHNAPPGCWSVLAEISESPAKPVDSRRVVDETIAGLRNVGAIAPGAEVVSTWHRRAEYGYPVPGLQRDAALAHLLPMLEGLGIYSRGRMGAWKYEVSNQDHSFMQGVEVASRLALGIAETTLTL